MRRRETRPTAHSDPTPDSHGAPRTRRTRARGLLLLVLGAAAGMACGGLGAEDSESAEGRVSAGGDLESHYTGIWTNWWRHEFDLEKGKAEGLLKLLAMRQALTRDNLFDVNGPKGPDLGRPIDCKGVSRTARTIDGTCNDLSRPTAGAAGARHGRNTKLEEIAPERENGTLLVPNPREISVKLLAREVEGGRPQVKEVDFLNLSAASWIQFQVHDWFAHPTQETEVYKVVYGKDTLFVPKSVEDDAKDLPLFPKLKVYKNENTHWWDGSQLYGSDVRTARRLRSKDGVHFDAASDLLPGGQLRLDADGLPVVDGKEDTGFNKNWWLGLSMLHTLFAREHNAIAKTIRAAHPELSDDEVYDKARMVNAAVMAKIHTVEWTPAILNNTQLRAGMNLNWNGLDLPGLGKRPGIVGSPMDPNLTQVPYSLTEEFVSVYRLHSLLPESVGLVSLKDGHRGSVEVVATRRGRIDVPSYSMADLFYSFGQQHPGQIALHNFPRFLQDLVPEIPLVGKLSTARVDMGTVDVLRDRERGVGRYNAFRRALKLKPITKLEDLFLLPPPGTPAGQPVTGKLTAEQRRYVEELEEVYGRGPEAVERLDLLVGCLAEGVRPDGFGFGETQFQVFVLMASRRLQADRFFTTDFRPEIYTPEGIAWVQRATMKGVLLRHYPELATALDGVENPFFPWKTDPRARAK